MGITEISKANNHIVMPFLRLALVCAEESVPPGKVETEVTVMLMDNHRVMDTVHIRRYKDRAQPLVYPFKEKDIAMVEHGIRIQEHFKNQDRIRRGPEQKNDTHFDGH